MFARHFQFDRFGSAFTPRKPRHPLLRFTLGLLGLALLGLLIFFGLFIGAAMIAVGIVYKLLSKRNGSVAATNADAMEGEFRVVDKPVLPSPH